MFDIFRTLFKFKEKESPDQLGLYPERVHVEAFPERRYLWTSRLLVILSCLSICFNAMLACAIYLMVPMIRVTPQFYNINKYFSQIEQVQRREIRFPVSDLVTEQYIYEYLILRYTITRDYEELLDRWKPGSSLYWYSSPAVYSEFRETDVPANLKQFKENGLQRFIEVEWIKPLSRGLWHVQFTTYDMTDSKPEPVVTYWRATMRIVYVKMNFANKEDRVLNPYGFLVLSYSLAYHGAEGDSESYIDTARRRAQAQ